MVIDPAGEEVAVLDFLKVQSREETGRGEFLAVSEDVFVETMMPIRFGKEGLKVDGHPGRVWNFRRLARRALFGSRRLLIDKN